MHTSREGILDLGVLSDGVRARCSIQADHPKWAATAGDRPDSFCLRRPTTIINSSSATRPTCAASRSARRQIHTARLHGPSTAVTRGSMVLQQFLQNLARTQLLLHPAGFRQNYG
jgi:hypothetical protein